MESIYRKNKYARMKQQYITEQHRSKTQKEINAAKYISLQNAVRFVSKTLARSALTTSLIQLTRQTLRLEKYKRKVSSLMYLLDKIGLMASTSINPLKETNMTRLQRKTRTKLKKTMRMMVIQHCKFQANIPSHRLVNEHDWRTEGFGR